MASKSLLTSFCLNMRKPIIIFSMPFKMACSLLSTMLCKTNTVRNPTHLRGNYFSILSIRALLGEIILSPCQKKITVLASTVSGLREGGDIYHHYAQE